MQKPVLVIMAAGMGSRYGGLKQIDPVDRWGNLIIDFSAFDAQRAGFERLVLVIKRSIEHEFREAAGKRLERHMDVIYAFQELSDIPEGVKMPEDRTKPLGTTQAVLAAKGAVGDAAFAVVNSDDYYGPGAFEKLFGFLQGGYGPYAHALVGYRIENTLTDHGHVSRGVCVLDAEGRLARIDERKRIIKTGECAAYIDAEGREVSIPRGTTVSMNCWGFGNGALDTLAERFQRMLAPGLERDPLGYEDLLPEAVCEALADGRTSVRVLPSQDRWFGVTYKEDKPDVMDAFLALKCKGLYPEKLWE